MNKDPMMAVTEAMEDSTDWMSAISTFMINLVAPEDEEGICMDVYTIP